jgi:hypothetical protein
MKIGDDEVYTLRLGKEYAHLFFDCQTWEYMSDEDDNKTYVCGTYQLNEEGTVVVDYDGVFELPALVRELLEGFYKVSL